MYCPKCGTDVNGIEKIISETYPVKGENITINAQVKVCECCGGTLWDDDLDNANLLKAFSMYRKEHGLLQPDEIREIRKKYKLSQTTFARILGFGDKTITRYENGSIADSAQNMLIDLVQQPHIFQYVLNKNRKRISEEEFAIAQKALNEYHPRILYSSTASSRPYSFSSTAYGETCTYNSIFWGDVNYA